jgi:acyl-CoA thioester hydrolase
MRRRPDHAVSLSAKVGFQQCDPLGVVWHGRYFEWLEAARGELFASRGLDIPELRDLGHRLYVVEARCRYMVPLTYGDTVRITAWFTQVDPLLRVAYDLEDLARGRWCARAHTTLAITGADGQLLSSTPAELRARLPQISAARPGPNS